MFQELCGAAQVFKFTSLRSSINRQGEASKT